MATDTPIGRFELVADDGALREIRLLDAAGGVVPSPGAEAACGAGRSPIAPRSGDQALLDRACHQLAEYFACARRSFDLSVAAAGTPFQRRVWERLRTIGYGETVSYGALAAALGSPRAARAVGAALARNPLPVVVPCHRVVGAAGDLRGFGLGLPAKRLLLDLESSACAGTMQV
jgi:methylated-DNA-[protein]-cysteine S-methyltransferase